MHTKDPHPDQRYIQALLDNDNRRIFEIYEKYSPLVLRLVKNNSGTADDAKDVMQDSLMAITRQARRGLVLSCAFSTFLYLVAKAKWLNELKKRKREQVTIREMERYIIDKHTEMLVLEITHEEAFYAAVEKKFEDLPGTCQEILALWWSGLSLAQMAEKLGITYNYVKKRKSECSSKLTEMVKNVFGN
jgi:RNA polymerase sigma factor (sigma-70 family)